MIAPVIRYGKGFQLASVFLYKGLKCHWALLSFLELSNSTVSVLPPPNPGQPHSTGGGGRGVVCILCTVIQYLGVFKTKDGYK